MEKYKWMIVLAVVVLLTTMSGITAFVSNTGNVAGAVENIWKAVLSQIKTMVNNVVFPTIDLVLTVLFFVKVAAAYMDYRKHGQIEWVPATILSAGLVFDLFTPMYVWQIVGI